MTATNHEPTLVEVLDWLSDNWDPELTMRGWWQRLADSGWGYPHFPVAWYGKGLQPATSGAVSRAIRDFGAVPSPVGFGAGLAAPTLLDHGTDEQRSRHLPGIVTGQDAYCQLFSEPNAGSDLAGLQCRAERDGDTWVINGQKVWTSSAQIANKAILVARTNVEVPKHAGISYFILDLDQPGVEIRPLRENTGRSYFNEVFMTDVRIAVGDLIGGEGNGWAVANTTLAYERGRRNTGGVGPWAQPGPIAGELDQRVGTFTSPRAMDSGMPTPQASSRLRSLARQLGRADDPLVRDRLVHLYLLERISGLNGQRGRALAERGQELPGLANLTKMAANHLTRLARDVSFDVIQAPGMLFGYDHEAVTSVEAIAGIEGLGEIVESGIFASAPPIFGGSDQIQRNIVGERVLGLPPRAGRHANDPLQGPSEELTCHSP